MKNLQGIYDAVLDGDAPAAQAGVKVALEEGVPADTILKQGLIEAIGEVGRRFETGEYFVPEMLVAARAMQAGLAILKPHLAASGAAPAGKVVVGTIKGDLHDIGKNLVAMMMEGTGFEVIDLGTDVSPEAFVAAVQQHHPQVIAISALLTTTMTNMAAAITALQVAGLREQVKVMVGGAPVTAEFAKKIGADGFSPDASSAARLASSLVHAA